MNKEKEPITSGRESVPVEVLPVESPRKQENVEVMSWMEKIEHRFGQSQKKSDDVNDDTGGVSAMLADQPPVTVAVTQSQMQVGQKAKTDLSIAWLVTWVAKQIKILLKQKRKVLFREEIPDAKS